ncbi:MAG: hypothetical protein JWQ78_1225 [Sediminibacterium sp.]|nr:hypothetical protein [Sediminibacterium sp.]
MFLFPLVYISLFITALVGLLKNKKEGVLLFFICALPIYTTTLSVTYMYGFPWLVPVLQSFKEILVLATLGSLLYNARGPLHFHLIDKLLLFFFAYTLLYVFIPIGQFTLVEKLLAFKSLSFFILVYFTGRFFDPTSISVSKYFHIICAVSIAAGLVLSYEVFTYQHLQTMTGYADYNYFFFKQDPSGNYDLSWTFEVNEIGKGAKRFASFFSNPLEYAAATVLTISILAGLYTTENNRIKVDGFGLAVLATTLFAIFFALSRASFVSYFLLIYAYSFITGKKMIILVINLFFLLAVSYVVFFAEKDVRDFIVNTLTFSNLSSLGHVVEWLGGIQSMITSPLGIGLGESGRIAGTTGDNVGGESQLIILGVQAGVLALGVYIAVYVMLINRAYRAFKTRKGKERKLSLALLLMKIGFIVPIITANF